MKFNYFIFFVIYCFGLSLAQTNPGCVINIKTDLPIKNEPVYLVKNFSGYRVLDFPSDSGSIILSKDQNFILACTGGKNSLVATGEETSVAKCSYGAKLIADAKEFYSKDLYCESRSAAALLLTSQTCSGPGTTLIQLGFKVGTDWFPLIDTCHNINEANSLWSKHVLYGTKLANKVIQPNRPGFSRGDKRLYNGLNPEQVYSQDSQEVQFHNIYGAISSKYIVKTKSFLAKGHLSPDADFLFGSWQMSTYFYINAAPQWQSINAGHWFGVETNVRKLAIKLHADLVDITGTFGILSLHDDFDIMKTAYLAGKRLPVPELIWKFLRNPIDNSCIVLIAINNPFLKSTPQTICTDICSLTGWPNYQKDFKKGYIYCCDYTTFKVAVPHAPSATCITTLNFK